MRALYNEISLILDKVNFDCLWKGFKRLDFALYNDEEVYLKDSVITKDNRFMGNTSIKFDDEYIAIWNVGDPTDVNPQILASKIVHEMFHGFQYINEECRFPNLFQLLDYPNNLRNYQLRHYENQLLVKAFKETDSTDKTNLLKEFFSIRKSRENLIGNIINCEYLTETQEGLAEYIGTKALKQISLSLYEERTNEYLDMLSNFNEHSFDIRRMGYFIGTILFLTLEDAKIDFYHDIKGCTETAYELATKNLVITDLENPIKADNIVFQAFNDYMVKKEKLFDDFLKNSSEPVNGNFLYYGSDPMNTYKLNNFIISKYFAILRNSDTNEDTYFYEAVMFELESDSSMKVVSYRKELNK